MSSSNLAVQMDHGHADLLREPPRVSRRAANPRTSETGKLRLSLTNRKLLSREVGLRYFRVR